MEKYNYKIIIYISILSFLLKSFLYFYSDINFDFLDTSTYFINGLNLLSNGIFTSDLHMPLYPIILAITNNSVFTIFFDISLSLGLSFFSYLVTKDLTKNINISIISFIIISFYPFFVFYSLAKLSEITFIFLFMTGLYFFLKEKFYISFILFILSTYCRATYDYLYPLLFIIILLQKNYNYKYIFIVMLKYLLIYVTLMSPWWYHNYKKYDQFVRLNLSAGHLLYSGNNPLNNSGGGVGHQDANKSDVDLTIFDHVNDPVKKEFLQRQTALEYIFDNKSKTFKMIFVKLNRLWRVTPYAENYQNIYYKSISYLSYGLLSFLTILFFISKTFSKYKLLSIIFLTIFLYLSFIHIITISSIRYRLPIEPFIIIIGSSYIYEIINYFKINLHGKKNKNINHS